MAQTSEHLQWVDLREFGGLWTAGASSMMPANKQQVMSGCHPQPGGGVRAFLKVTDTVDGTGIDTSYLNLPGGTGDYASCADSGALDITGDIDLRALVALTDWTPAATQVVLSDYKASTNVGWSLNVTSAGLLEIAWGNGAATLAHTSTVAVGFTDGTKHWIRASLDVNDGAGNRVAKFYTSDNGVAWTQLGTTVTTAGTTTIAASTEGLRISGHPASTNPMTGKFYRGQVRSGALLDTMLGDVAIAQPAFTSRYPGGSGPTTYDDQLGNSFTLSGTASVVRDGTDPILVGAHVVTIAGAGTRPVLALATVDSPGTTAMNNWNLWTRDYDPDGDAQFWSLVRSARWSGINTSSFGVAETYLPAQPSFVHLRINDGTEIFVGLAIKEVLTSSTAPAATGVHQVDLIGQLVNYSIDPNGDTAALTSFGALGSQAVVEHQGRLVIAQLDKVAFTGPASESLTAAGSGSFFPGPLGFFLAGGVQGVSSGGIVAWMLPVPPSDLIIATRDGRVYSAQGDLGDPTIRELGRWTVMLPHEPANTPNGIFFIIPNQGVARLGLDGSVETVSSDILPAVWNLVAPRTGLGQIVGTERYLFCPNQHTTTEHKNGALVRDMETGAWFTSTHADDYTITNPRYIQADENARDSGVWLATSASPTVQGASAALMFRYRTGGYDSASTTTEARGSTYEFKTAPLRDPSGRRVVIREVEIPTYAFDSGGPVLSTLAVTVNGTTITRSLPPGRSTQVFRFRETGEFLDINVKAKSNTASLEAPMVESLRFGWRPGPTIR